jgi:hypothetical protein
MRAASSSTIYGQWLQVTKLPSSLGFQYVDTDGDSVVATDTGGNIYYATRTISSIETSTGVKSYSNDIFKNPIWIQKPGVLSSISISSNKIVGCNNSNQVWYSPTLSTNGDWTELTNITGKLKIISYDLLSGLIGGIRTDLTNNTLTFADNTNTGNKYPITNTLNASIYNGNIYIINSVDYGVYYLKNIKTQGLWNNNYGYVQTPTYNYTKFKQIDFTDNLLVAVDVNNNLWATYDVYNSNPFWFEIPNANFKQVSVSNNGIFGIDINNNLYGLQYTLHPLVCKVISYSTNDNDNVEYYINYFPVPGSNVKSFIINTVNSSLPTFYDDCPYSGNSKQLGIGLYNDNNLFPTNKTLSSLKIPQGYNVTLYSDLNFSGNSVNFQATNQDINICCLAKAYTCTPTYTLAEFNDQTSSIEIKNDIPLNTYSTFTFTDNFDSTNLINKGNILSFYKITSNLTTLTYLKRGNKYNFAVRAILHNEHVSPLSNYLAFKIPNLNESASAIILESKPSKITDIISSPSTSSVNLNFNIPDNGGTPVTQYKIKSYFGNNQCGPKINVDMTNPDDPYYSIFKDPPGSQINFNFSNLNERKSYDNTADKTKLPSCEPFKYIKTENYIESSNEYLKIPHKKIITEPYIFTLKAVNDVGESDMSEPTTQDIVPLVETPLPTIPPSPTGTIEIPPSPTGPVKIEPQIPVKKDNNIIFIVLIVLTIFIIIGGGIWFFYNKNNVSPEILK